MILLHAAPLVAVSYCIWLLLAPPGVLPTWARRLVVVVLLLAGAGLVATLDPEAHHEHSSAGVVGIPFLGQDRLAPCPALGAASRADLGCLLACDLRARDHLGGDRPIPRALSSPLAPAELRLKCFRAAGERRNRAGGRPASHE